MATQRPSWLPTSVPAATCVRETVSTLGFAQRAKQIKNKVRITALYPPLTRVLAHICELQLLDMHGMPQQDWAGGAYQDRGLWLGVGLRMLGILQSLNTTSSLICDETLCST